MQQLFIRFLSVVCLFFVNFAAETHVDKSITDPASFVKSDVLGTQNLLELVRKYEVEKYIQICANLLLFTNIIVLFVCDGII